MKKLVSLLVVSSVVLLSSFTRQNSGIDEVIAALRTGNSVELSSYFDDNIELTLPDRSDNYSKAQAQQIIRDFFANNPVKGFDLKHKGNSPGGGHYCIGTLQTTTSNFRTNVFMVMKNGKELIRDIRFQSIE